MQYSASLLILNPQGQLLLLQRSQAGGRFPGAWEFPGGKIDQGETPFEAMVREVREESGIQADVPVCEPSWRGPAAGEVEYAFFVWRTPAEALAVTLSDEHSAYAWVTFTEARKRPMMPPHREFMDRFWIQGQIEAYEQERPSYVAYRKFLEQVLQQLRGRWAPLAIVQAREKSLSSFSEKCVRKADKYNDPAQQLTDLCGARIIATTTEEEDILIRQIKKLFAVDEFEDTRGRHDIGAFGYLSVHFVVHVPEGAREVLGVPVPPELGARKAEIQVRTMLQHAHSEVTHDRLYKSGFTVPPTRRREAARIAAVLESGDDEFARFVRQLDAYVGNYAAQLPPEKRRREMEDLRLVLQNEPEASKKPALALRRARLARAAWDWEGVVECAEPYVAAASPATEALKMELGNALCRLHADRPAGAEFRRGMEWLEKVAKAAEPVDGRAEADERDRRATALAWLGWASAHIPGRRAAARSCLARAVELAPEDPYHVATFVELVIVAGSAEESLGLLAPSLRQAAGRCLEHVRAGIEVTRAWLTLARLRFFLNDPYAALEALCLGSRFAETAHPLAEAARSFAQLQDAIGERRPEIKWLGAAAQLLALAKQRAAAPEGASFDWQPLEARFEYDPALPVTILAGATAAGAAARLAAYEPLLVEGLAGRKGALISGGTAAGVCSLAARVAQRVNAAEPGSLQLVGYVPAELPGGVALDPGYSNLVSAEGTREFSLFESIQMWSDLLTSVVRPAGVRLICLGGGDLSAGELALAWALGATAAVVADDSVAAGRFAHVLSWAGGQSAWGILLPDDPATLSAFFLFNTPIDETAWEKSGEAVHHAYLISQQKSARQANLLPWNLLREDFKHSNRHQAACSVAILRRGGFLVEPTTLAADRIPLLALTEEEIERMSEWEHGRWNVERLLAGWRYGEKKDEAARLSPYVVSWIDLPDAIKGYDRAAVRDWPRILAQAGWKVERAEAAAPGNK